MLAQLVELLDFVYIAGVRYGCTSSRRTLNDRHIMARFPDSQLSACRIEHIFRLCIKNEEPILIAAVRRFVACEDLPILPWDLRYVSCFFLARSALNAGFTLALPN